MSRTEARAVIFGWLGELLWYLAGSDEYSFVKYYISNYKQDAPNAARVHAAYGPRLKSKNKDQLKWIVDLLKSKPQSRRAVIPIYHPKDTHSNLQEVPCTCTLQFLIRGGRLEMITHMRSNDAFIGLPGDIFSFTMIQEIVARSLGIEVGTYKHLIGSLHLYEENRRTAEKYLAEGYQESVTMPNMPLGDQFPYIERLLRYERSTRLGRKPKIPKDLPVYWQDISMLLSIFRAGKDHLPAKNIRIMRKKMNTDSYRPYIEMRQRQAERREADQSSQPNLPFEITDEK
jgi:thymidylate synthase